jgi:hypothetical protein
MSTPLVLLVSRSASRSQCYREALDKQGLSCLVISEIKEAPTLTTGTPFSGILLDMPVLTKATAIDKSALEDILKALPSVYLNIAPASDAIRVLTADATQGIAKTLEEFALICKNFTPRMVRPKDRYLLYLNAVLSENTVPCQEEQTVTLNVSPRGCFLFTANPDFQINQSITIQFIGLTDTTPIKASVCWFRRWGDKGHHLPGIGVKFDTITENQSKQMATLIEALKPR